MDFNSAMGMFDMLYFILAFVAIGMGIKQIVTGKLTGKRANEYTKESQAKFAKIEGLCDIGVGLGAAIMSMSSSFGLLPKWGNIAGMVLAIASLVVDAIMAKKMLVPKNPMKDIMKK